MVFSHLSIYVFYAEVLILLDKFNFTSKTISCFMKQEVEESDKKAWSIFRDALKSIEFPNYVDVSEREDGTVSFTLSISYEDGTSAFIMFKPGTKVIKEILQLSNNLSDNNKIPNSSFEKEFEKRFAALVAHIFLKNFPVEIEETLGGLNEIPLIMPSLLMAEIDSHAPNFSKEKKAERIEQAKNALESLLEERKQRTKKRILDEIEMVEKPYQPAKHLISIYYEDLLPKWEQAKDCYKKNKKFNNWEKMVAISFEELPVDLINRLGDPDTYTAMPSSIALEHAARMCGINDNSLGLRALQKYLQQSREWVKKVGNEQADKELKRHFDNAIKEVGTFYQVAKLLGKENVTFKNYSLLHKTIDKDWGETIKKIIAEKEAQNNDEQGESSLVH
jgi:hypothetical protein